MALCDNCSTFKSHGKKCWYYWELKRQCSQFKRAPHDEPIFMEEE